MGKYFVDVTDEAKKHLSFHHKSGNKSTTKRIKRIIKELSESPYSGIGKPELLKYQYSGYWSRRINKKDRMIYKVSESTVTVLIVSAKGHYGDR
ncbi:Txe/YoeB family addiction module toxin [Membranihabitans maritimus]|uniref:Txe/YoeB family addiction module toxin n=1 Tax=Membranihabitans maritimus TaxID=2904244 RepID=UPI001F00EDCC|nr:Txe/YoeB family addiction module toxin [Membranihabitans maritimus]